MGKGVEVQMTEGAGFDKAITGLLSQLVVRKRKPSTFRKEGGQSPSKYTFPRKVSKAVVPFDIKECQQKWVSVVSPD